MKDNNKFVKTAIRWRPTDEDENVIIRKCNESTISFGSQPKIFCFDHVIDTSDQNEVYKILVKPLVDKAVEGYDCTFLASGQTGSGKTYTMGFESSNLPENNGMTTRVLNSIFSYDDAKQIKVLISFVEVYNDQAFDLLGQNAQQPFFKKDFGTSWANKKSVQNESEVLALLAQGTKNRRVRETRMNATSSRSHAVFTIELKIQDTEDKIRVSVLNLVDLAGSECVEKTGNTGKESIVEGKSINESLSAFKRVIIAMSIGASHIPFRDAMMTYMLRKSLNIDCYLTLLGCVSPFQHDYGETLSTLGFVAEAKLIKRTPQLNAVINELQTPVKMSFQTPNSSLRLATSFLHTGPMSEPHRSRSIVGNLRPQKRFVRVPTEKTMSLTNSRNKRSSVGLNRSKVVNSLFPARTKAVDASQDTTNTSEVHRFVERLINKMTDTGFNRNTIDVIGELAGALTNVNDGNSTITGSFYSTPTQTMLPTVMENCSRVNSSKKANTTLKNEPINDHIISTSLSEEQNIDCIQSLMSINYDHVAKKIIFEVDKATSDNVCDIMDVSSSPQIVPDTNEEASSLKSDLFDGRIGEISADIQGNPLNETHTSEPSLDCNTSLNVSINSEHAKRKIRFEVNNQTDDNVTTNVTTTDLPTTQTVSLETTQEVSSLKCVSFDDPIGENSDEFQGEPLKETHKSKLSIGTNPSLNVSINSEHAKKKIRFEVNTTTGDNVYVTAIDLRKPQIASDTTQEASPVKCNSFDGGIEENSDEFQGDPLNETHKSEPSIDPNPSLNVSINSEDAENNILFEVHNKTGDNVTAIDLTTPQTVQPDAIQEASSLKCNGGIGENSDEFQGGPLKETHTSQPSLDRNTSLNVLINSEDVENNILFEVHNTTAIDLPTPPTTQEVRALKCDSFDGRIGENSDEFQGDPLKETHKSKLSIDTNPSLNVSMNSEHVKKKICFEVNTTTGDNVYVTAIDLPKPQIASTQKAPVKCNSFDGGICENSDEFQADPLKETHTSSLDRNTSLNISINSEPTKKKIRFEVNNKIDDNVTTTDLPKPQIASPETTQEASPLRCVSFDGGIVENSSIGEFQGSPFSPGADDMLNNETMENASPMIKKVPDANVRTPIGKLVFRRLVHSNKFEETQYEVEIVHKVRKPLDMPPSSLEMDYDYTMPNNEAHPLSTSSPIASKTNHLAHHFSTYPRLVLHRVNTIQDYYRHSNHLAHHFPQLVLHRINTIQDYHRHYGTQQDPPQARTKLKRKLPQTKSPRTPRSQARDDQPMEKDLGHKILDILNNASEKDLQKLATIGPKTATQLFNYRNIKGKFKNLDSLLKMPFWSKKTHERFIAYNLFV